MFKLQDHSTFEVEINGTTHLLKEPAVGQIRAFTKALASPSSDPIDTMISFLGSLGLPEDKVEKMGVNQLKQLIEHLSGELSEKK